VKGEGRLSEEGKAAGALEQRRFAEDRGCNQEEESSRVARVECKTTLPAITEALRKLKLWLWYMLHHFIRVGVA
jgi:hypothetical protein